MCLAVGADPNGLEMRTIAKRHLLGQLGAKVIGPELTPILVDHWLSGEFQGGGSGRKVDKISDLDRREAAESGR